MFTLFKIKYLKQSILLILIIGFTSCYEYPELSDIHYDEYRRVIGPDGGTINFYENYEDDSIKDIIVKMDFPVGALDSFVVFNMHEFNDTFAENDLYNLEMFINTQFLYFIPFYESDGYNEHAQEDIDYHLSLNFNDSVSITYNLNNYFSIDNNTISEESILSGDTKLYRIKIPALDEWEENIWVNWNIQGYPDGYDNIDLVYLITGRWTELSGWSNGDLSLENWMDDVKYSYDSENKTITFKIKDTDYMYVMGEYYGI